MKVCAKIFSATYPNLQLNNWMWMFNSGCSRYLTGTIKSNIISTVYQGNSQVAVCIDSS